VPENFTTADHKERWSAPPVNLFSGHKALLEQPVEAIYTRGYWTPFTEMPSPKVYGETANDDGKKAFEALLKKPFPLNQPGAGVALEALVRLNKKSFELAYAVMHTTGQGFMMAFQAGGIGLVIGCCTFPTWNSYPGLFANLATGNAVVVKPYPGDRFHRQFVERGLAILGPNVYRAAKPVCAENRN
jgi:hypothetical protein